MLTMFMIQVTNPMRAAFAATRLPSQRPGSSRSFDLTESKPLSKDGGQQVDVECAREDKTDTSGAGDFDGPEARLRRYWLRST